ncbi:hypothetical protein KM176_20890 [Pseudooceanicola sp. CBS1P-1]|uniref:Uncharacterized protein n=1 Tax=Pseudooceanicola albus TaxID=2692189 RepID=A0A6L7GCA4_9RHOB|nr:MULTISPECIES: hypothetical protein [Pseudooceanicola]MBT9386339.1 hypothetical protein [Pseudooceanicola endophyticus]MXN21178.1 hypothetical protein [Pseudooceanicola albus]
MSRFSLLPSAFAAFIAAIPIASYADQPNRTFVIGGFAWVTGDLAEALNEAFTKAEKMGLSGVSLVKYDRRYKPGRGKHYIVTVMGTNSSGEWMTLAYSTVISH